VAPAEEFLATVESVLVVDWPSRDVTDSLVRAGRSVIVKGGPEPDNYAAYEVVAGRFVSRPLGHPPEHVDLVYAHRPLGELPAIVELACGLGARAVWLQSGRSDDGDRDPKGCWLPPDEADRARSLVEAAGLAFFASPYIGDAVRREP
jgi:predicted CoA-binding protein